MCHRKYLKCHVELVTYTVPSELHATNDLEVKSTDDFILVRVNFTNTLADVPSEQRCSRKSFFKLLYKRTKNATKDFGRK